MDTTTSDIAGSTGNPSWLNSLMGIGNSAAQALVQRAISGDEAVQESSPAAISGTAPEKKGSVMLFVENNWKLILGAVFVLGAFLYFKRR